MRKSKRSTLSPALSPPAESTTAPEPAALHTSDQAYELAEIHRDQILFADYNPRTITEEARALLRKGLEKSGLVAPLTWNKRTGRVVGGHQRLKALDAIAGSRDYRLRVAAIDVDEARERELNILLNNGDAQGEWEVEKLVEMLRAPDFDHEAAGMSGSSMFALLRDEAPDAVLEDIADKIEKTRQAAEKVSEAANGKHDAHYFLVVTFRDHYDRLAFTSALELDDNRYQDGRLLWQALERKRDAPPFELPDGVQQHSMRPIVADNEQSSSSSDEATGASS